MRRDIQSLRGIAILSVLLFHLGFTQVRGGFLGVDTFFVISGFVITGRLSKGSGNKWQQIKVFYQARAKRILPSSLVVVVITAVVGLFLVSTLSLKSVAQDALASSLFSANIGFLLHQSNYLASTLDASPFLHYWSLGVEEQFYLFWPLLYLFFFKKHKRWIPPFLVISAIFAIWYTQVDPIASFYLPFTRVWEFMAGALITTLPSPKIKDVQKQFYTSALWFLLIGSFFWISVNDATPGITTLLPIVCTALLIWIGFEVPEMNFLVWLGDISFTLYLVHWPVVIFVMSGVAHPSTVLKLQCLLISLALAVIISDLVEKPFRYSKRLAFSLPKWGVALALVATASYSVLNLGTASAFKGNYEFSIDASLPITYSDGCHLDFNVDWPKNQCIFGDTTSTKEIVLAGDSHAAQWFPAFQQLAETHGWKLLNLTKSSCPTSDISTLRSGVLDTSCLRWRQRVIDRINRDKPALIVFSNFTQFDYALSKSSQSYHDQWNHGESLFVGRLNVPKYQIVLLGDTPKPPSNSLACLTQKIHAKSPQACNFQNIPSAQTLESRNLAHKLGILYIDPTPWFCSSQICPAVVDGWNVYRDNSHLSVTAAERVSTKLWRTLSSVSTISN